jgi:hypothetical protein
MAPQALSKVLCAFIYTALALHELRQGQAGLQAQLSGVAVKPCGSFHHLAQTRFHQVLHLGREGQRQFSPDQYEIVDVRTSQGVRWLML